MISPLQIRDYFDLGLVAIPIVWDTENKKAERHPPHGEIKTFEDTLPYIDGSNGVALKLLPPWGMIDFDLKNTTESGLYENWARAIDFIDDKILPKCCIEKTRSGGFHVYVKYARLRSKATLAQSIDKKEVISIYTGGLLSYTDPTPGYSILHGSLEDVEPLTDEDFETLSTVAMSFNRAKEIQHTPVTVDYPREYERQLHAFDQILPEYFEQLLQSIGLQQSARQPRGKKYVAYTRDGSTSDYSAKAYFGRVKKLLIFSGSMSPFPSWHDRTSDEDHSWILTASRICYYKNGSWPAAVEEIRTIADSCGMDLPGESLTVTHERPEFPIDVFHPEIADALARIATERSIPLQYLHSTAIWAVMALSGNMYRTELADIKNIMYLLLVGPSGVGKTPAYKILVGDIIAPREKYLQQEYQSERKKWNHERRKKDDNAEYTPAPVLYTRMLKGGTVEGIMRHAAHAPAGFGIYYDEGNRMLSSPNAYKKDTGSLDFWNESWNGSSFFEARADEDRERYVAETSISVVAGMQTDRMADYFTQDSIQSGIAGRFLLSVSSFIPLVEHKDAFETSGVQLPERWTEVVMHLFNRGAQSFDQVVIPFTDDAKPVYNDCLNRFRARSNKERLTANKDGIDALMLSYDVKLYAYFSRLLIPLAILKDLHRPVITPDIVKAAERLYWLYRADARTVFTGMLQSGSGMTQNEQLLWDALPDRVNSARIVEILKELKLSPTFFHMTFGRKWKKDGWLRMESRGEYIKLI